MTSTKQKTDPTIDKQRFVMRWWHELAVAGLLAFVVLIACSLQPQVFFDLGKQIRLLKYLWPIVLLSLGMTLIIITGGIDLSVGSMMALCAIAFGYSYALTDSAVIGVAACLLTGLVCGLLNGVLVSRLSLHPLIATLATFALFKGIAEGFSQGENYSLLEANISWLARGGVLGVPYPGWLTLGLSIFVAMLLAKSTWGRYVYAIGINEEAALFSGVPVRRVKMALYATSGVLAGLAAVIAVAREETADAELGNGIELAVITAVVVGGTSIMGGRGNIVGTLLGVFLIHETRQFFEIYWNSEEWIPIVIGVLLIGAILVYRALSSGEQRDT